jgi:hypothetical protein
MTELNGMTNRLLCILFCIGMTGCLKAPDGAEESYGRNQLALDENPGVVNAITVGGPYVNGNGQPNWDVMPMTFGNAGGGSPVWNQVVVLVAGSGACGDCYSCNPANGFTDTNGSNHSIIDPLSFDCVTGTNDCNKTGVFGHGSDGYTLFNIGVLRGANSPFATGWSYAYFPNTNGDAFTGNGQRVNYGTNTAPPGYTCQNGQSITHNGYANFGAMLDELHKIFPNPDRLVFWGGSSGGLGVICNMSQIRSKFPNAQIYAMDDGGVPLVAQDDGGGVAPNVALWGDENHWHAYHTSGGLGYDTCPFDSLGVGNAWGPEDLDRYNQVHLASSSTVLASRQSTADAVMAFFAGYLGASGDGSAAVKRSLTFDLTRDMNGTGDVTLSNPYYRVMFGSANVHAIVDDKTQDLFSSFSDNGVALWPFVWGWLGVPGYEGYFSSSTWANYPN